MNFARQIGLLLLTCALLASTQAFAQGSENVILLDQFNDYAFSGYNDCWGYTAPDGREYALLGITNGTSIVDITEDDNMYEVAFISGPNSTWKDIKTFQEYAYVVTESSGGMQILDLSDLPNSVSLAATFNSLSSSHNIYIDTEEAVLYAEGSFSDPVRIFTLDNPLSPAEVAGLGIECHDVFARDGLLFVSEGGSGSIGIYNVSDPSAPQLIERVNVPAAGYVHNVWSNEDNSLMMSTEETGGKTVKLWDIANLDEISITDDILAPDGLAHNAHIKGDYAYVSHYGDGMRIIDITDPENIFEAGYYDTYPGPGGGFVGSWGAYPFFASGKVLISDFSTGLYVVYFAGAVEADASDPNPVAELSAYSDFETPNSVELAWSDPLTYVNGDPLNDFTVEIYRDENLLTSVEDGAQAYTDIGLVDGQSYTYELIVRDSNDSLSRSTSAMAYAGGSAIPAAPANLQCATSEVAATLTWEDPISQEDGTPLDDLNYIGLWRNGEMIASIEGGVGTYEDTPVPGFAYTYTVTAVDTEDPANESGASNEVTCFVGDTPDVLIWLGPDAIDASAASGDSLFEAVASTGLSVFFTDNLFEFGEALPGFQAVFVVLGIFPNNHVIDGNSPEATALEAYLASGGRLYLEGGDCYNYDPEVGGHDIRPWFGLGDGGDGGEDVFGLNGENQLDGFTLAYTGENNWMDELSPQNSTPILRNSGNNDIHGVYYQNPDNGSITIGVVPSFGGLSPVDVLQPGEGEDIAAANRIKPARPERGERAPFQKRYSYRPELRDKLTGRPNLLGTSGNGDMHVIAATESELIMAYLTLLGTLGEFPEISLSSEAIDFGAVETGKDSVIALTIFNNGVADLEVSDITLSNLVFAVDQTTFTVPASGGSLSLQVTFSPEDVSDYSGEMLIYSNDPFSAEMTVALSGSGDEPTGIESEQLPREFALQANYPNPFNPSTTIVYEVPYASVVQVDVFNMLGQKVRTLVKGLTAAGQHAVVWNALNDNAQPVGSGIYFYRFEAEGRQIGMRKMILLK